MKASVSIIPPEVYKLQFTNFSKQIDIWSYGVLVYQLFTNKSIIN